jgi:hypothetical protein
MDRNDIALILLHGIVSGKHWELHTQDEGSVEVAKAFEIADEFIRQRDERSGSS